MTEPVADAVEIRLRDVSQLFNTLDPFPFRERDLANEAEEFIIDHAQELPTDQPIRIVVYLQKEPDPHARADVPQAIASWFAAKADAESRAVQLHFRDGRLAFLVGLGILTICMLIAWSLTQRFDESPFMRVLQESLVIIGWVVIWRPVEMFLYDWVPIFRRRKLYRRLATAHVSVERLPS